MEIISACYNLHILAIFQVVEAFKKAHQKVLGSPYSIVFDGLKNIYTCRRLNFPAEFEGNAFCWVFLVDLILIKCWIKTEKFQQCIGMGEVRRFSTEWVKLRN